MLINGEAYTWSQIILNLFGVPIAGVESIEYDDSQDIVNNAGAGSQPVSRGFGAITYTGKIGIHMEEWEAIAAQAPQGRVQLIPAFDIQVSWQPRNVGSPIVPKTHKLKNCVFMNNGVSVTTGDNKIVREINILPAGIDFTGSLFSV